MKQIFTLSFLVLSVLLVSGCCEDEPVIIVPEPEAAPPSITGTISTNGGVPLEGVTVTVSSNGKTYSATTDEKGLYSVVVSAEGKYDVNAEKIGYTSKYGEVITMSDVTSVWNAILPQPVVFTTAVYSDMDTTIKVSIPPLIETRSGEDSLAMRFSTASLGEDDSLVIIVEYREPVVSKAEVMMPLLVARYYLASGNELKSPINITVDMQASPNQVFLNEENIAFSFDSAAKLVRINTMKQGTLVLNYMVNITEDMSGTTPIDFKQSVWNNFYGYAEMHILNPEYTLKNGGSVKGNNSLLTTMGVNYTGMPSLSSQTTNYPLNLTLPVGGKLVLEGKQAIHKYNFSVADGLMYCTISVYESAYITATTYNRQHTGGSD